MRLPSASEKEFWSTVVAIGLIGLVKAVAWIIGL
jgi:hypothetical protein